jgi:hypothetical protein
VLSQYDIEDILPPVALFSEKHCPALMNYEIYEKELLAIVWAFTVSNLLAEGSLLPIEVTFNYHNLTYFTINSLLKYGQT